MPKRGATKHIKTGENGHCHIQKTTCSRTDTEITWCIRVAKKNHIKIKFNDKKWFVIVLIHKNELHQIRPFGNLVGIPASNPRKDVFVQLPRELPKSQGISVIAPQLHQIRPFWKLTPNPTITHLDRRRDQTHTGGQFSI